MRRPGFIAAVALYFTLRSGFFQVRRFGFIMSRTAGSLLQKAGAARKGRLTPFQAASTALASTVGMGNLAASGLGNVVPLPESTPRIRSKVSVFPVLRSRPASTSRATAFRRAFYPTATDKEWNDWQWQIRNRLRHLDQLERMLHLSDHERSAVEMIQSKLPVGITPYFMGLLSKDDAADPLRRTVVPTVFEFTKSAGEDDDPLGEDDQSPVPGLVHRYPDRVLLLVLDFCSAYCRNCTRSRVVGHGAIIIMLLITGDSPWMARISFISPGGTFNGVPMIMPFVTLPFRGALTIMPAVALSDSSSGHLYVRAPRFTGKRISRKFMGDFIILFSILSLCDNETGHLETLL